MFITASHRVCCSVKGIFKMFQTQLYYLLPESFLLYDFSTGLESSSVAQSWPNNVLGPAWVWPPSTMKEKEMMLIHLMNARSLC